jgi:hypothetical protein
MDEGMINFSLDYPSDYKIDYLEPADTTGDPTIQSAYLSFKGPKDRNVNDYTRIGIGVNPPDNYAKDAKNLSEIAEKKAASWKYYELFYKGETNVSGMHAYRLDFQNIDIVPAIAGDGEPGIEVTRRVDFDANGFIWTIYIISPASTAETDKVDFEHILDTFTILN